MRYLFDLDGVLCEQREHMTAEAGEIIERKYPVLTGEEWYGTWGER